MDRKQPAGEPVWLGIDATSIERPESKTSPDRTVVYKPNLPESSKPISSGWQFSTVVLLPKQSSSWTAVLDQQRIRSDQTSVEVAAAQLRQLAPLLGCRPIVATDRWIPDAVSVGPDAIRVLLRCAALLVPGAVVLWWGDRSLNLRRYFAVGRAEGA